MAGGAGLPVWVAWKPKLVDSTVTRAHQHAAGARRDPSAQAEPPVGEPADHGLGRSRGGLTSKLHLACEQGQKLMSLVVTAWQRGDSPQFAAVLGRIRVPRIGRGRPRTRPDRVLADEAYSSKANRALLARLRQTIIAVLRTRDGLVVSYRNYLDPLVLAETLASVGNA